MIAHSSVPLHIHELMISLDLSISLSQTRAHTTLFAMEQIANHLCCFIFRISQSDVDRVTFPFFNLCLLEGHLDRTFPLLLHCTSQTITAWMVKMAVCRLRQRQIVGVQFYLTISLSPYLAHTLTEHRVTKVSNWKETLEANWLGREVFFEACW